MKWLRESRWLVEEIGESDVDFNTLKKYPEQKPEKLIRMVRYPTTGGKKSGEGKNFLFIDPRETVILKVKKLFRDIGSRVYSERGITWIQLDEKVPVKEIKQRLSSIFGEYGIEGGFYVWYFQTPKGEEFAISVYADTPSTRVIDIQPTKYFYREED